MFFFSRFTQVVGNQLDGFLGVVLGEATLVTSGQGFDQFRTALDPLRQVVLRYMRRAVGEVQQRQLALRIALENKR